MSCRAEGELFPSNLVYAILGHFSEKKAGADFEVRHGNTEVSAPFCNGKKEAIDVFIKSPIDNFAIFLDRRMKK